MQDFVQLRDSCLENGTLFEDDSFPAEDSSIYYSKQCERDIVWLRPTEIVEDPQLFVEGGSRFDVKQGAMGDCWLLSAVASLSLNERLLHHVVPVDQSFTENYAGIFRFRIWQYGNWVDVVVDDRLPTRDGRLVFLKSHTENEFWSALLEKAYAKLHGSYEALDGGFTSEAMEDFTGGLSEIYKLNESPPNLFQILLKAQERSSLMCCTTHGDPNQREGKGPLGLITGHAYSITSVKMMDFQTSEISGEIPMIRIRNPWGSDAEWKGAWSDQSPEWQLVSTEEKEEMGLTFDHDGEFWMSFDDFLTYYFHMEILNLNPDSLEEEELSGNDSKRWSANGFTGNWVKGASAGGCRSNLESFHLNPQYRITLEDPDDDDEEEKCTVIVALMQKNRRAQRKMGLQHLAIGFTIYHLEDPETAPKPIDTNFVQYNTDLANSPFSYHREISSRFKLSPGVYAIIPSTIEPNEEGEFLLRVFSETKNIMEENDEEVDRPIDEADEDVKCNDTFDDSSEVVQSFRDVAGEDMEIDWVELQNVLNSTFKSECEGFSKEVCRSITVMLDKDHSGKLGFEEFKSLCSDIQTWMNTFKKYDHDQSNSLSTLELRSALHAIGYRLNYHFLNALVLRYGNREDTLNFDDFILCVLKMKRINDIIVTFKKRDPDNTGSATYTLEELINKTLYC